MDPFGDNSDTGDLSSFQAPADTAAYSNDFYEVDSGEAAAAQASSFSFGDDAGAAAPVAQDAPVDFGASYGQQQDFSASYSEQTVTSSSRTASFETQQHTTTVTSSGSRTGSFEKQSSRHSSFQASGSRTSSFGQAGAAAQIPVIEEENELTKFMRVYEQQIAEKAVEQEKVAVESKEKAKSDMEKFVAERSRIKESKQQANRVHEQATLEKLAADLEAENPWERVVSLVELEANRKQKLAALNAKKDGKGKDADSKPAAKKESDEEEDVSRMRQLFVQLKAEPLEQTRSIASH